MFPVLYIFMYIYGVAKNISEASKRKMADMFWLYEFSNGDWDKSAALLDEDMEILLLLVYYH